MTGSLRVGSERSRSRDSSRLAASRGRRLRFEGLETRSLLAVSIAGLAVSPDPVGPGQTLTLTAQDVQTTTGQVTNAAFYRESNGTADLQVGTGGDTPVGTDTDGADGWSAAVLIDGLASGNYTYYARAAASDGNVSPAVSATSVVGQVQSITASPNQLAVRPDDAVSFDVNYATFPSVTGLPGVHVRMHFNSNLLGFDGITNLLGFGAVGTAPSVNSDTKDYDHDPTTDTCVVMAWIDINSTWPGAATARLYTANFTALSSGEPNASTRINFTSGDAPTDWTVSSRPATVEISENSPPTISGVNALPQAVTDKTTVQPFSGATIADPDLQSLTTTVTLDATAKGMLTGGFANTAPGVYSFTGSAADTTTAIRALVFHPTENRVFPTATETTVFTISVDDGVAAPATNGDTTVASTSVNDPPTIANIPDQTTMQNASLGPIAFTVGDPDVGESLGLIAYSSDTTVIPNANIGLAGSGASRTITLTPAPDAMGQTTIAVTVSDGRGGEATDTFTVQVFGDSNMPPVISAVADKITAENSTITVDFTVGDDQTPVDSLVLSASSSNTDLVPNTASALSFSGQGSTRHLTVSPTAAQTGSTSITVTATDGGGLSATETFTLIVTQQAGSVDYVVAAGQNPAGGDLWYALTTQRSGTLTLIALSQTPVSGATLGLYDAGLARLDTPGEHLLHAANPLAADRIDHEVAVNQTYYLRLSGPNAAMDLYLANLVRLQNGTLLAYGTADPDHVQIVAGAERTLRLDALWYDYSSTEVTTITFNGLGGRDVVNLTGSSLGESVNILPGQATLSGGEATVNLMSSETITYHSGGGSDTARLYDSDGDDTLVAGPGEAILSDGSTYQIDVLGAAIMAYAAYQGHDVAQLNDSTGANYFVNSGDIGKLIGDGMSLRVFSFEEVKAHSEAGGKDSAMLFDSTGDDTLDASPGTVELAYANGHTATAYGFASTFGYAMQGGEDTANMHGSSGVDSLTVGVVVNTQSRQTTRKATLTDAANTYLNQADGFEQVTVDGDLTDHAYLYDSAGDDNFDGLPGGGTLMHSFGSITTLAGFGDVRVYGSLGYDRATLRGGAGNDSFVGRPDFCRFYSGGMYTWIYGFDEVHAIAGAGGTDNAFLYDSAGDDRLDADADWATLHDAALSQYFLEVQGFGKVTATASTGTNLRKIVNPAFNLQYVGDWTDLA